MLSVRMGALSSGFLFLILSGRDPGPFAWSNRTKSHTWRQMEEVSESFAAAVCSCRCGVFVCVSIYL